MPRKRRIGRARVAGADWLTDGQRWELLLGPRASDPVTGRPLSAFASEGARRAAWLKHRDNLVAVGSDFVPWAARQYDGADGGPATWADDFDGSGVWGD